MAATPRFPDWYLYLPRLDGEAREAFIQEMRALDPITRDELQTELKRLQQSLGLTVVLVTHDITEALLLADKIAVMKDGRILGHDTPAALLAAPPHEYVQRLMAMPKRQAGRVAQLSTLGA